MKSRIIYYLTILAALALTSCKKEWECTLKIKSVYILGNGETFRYEHTYYVPFQGSRKEMKAFEDEETEVFTIKKHPPVIMQTNVMTCR